MPATLTECFTLSVTATQPPRSSLPGILSEVYAELGVARSTFYQWRQLGRAPRCIKLPNGELRIRRADLDAWIEQHTDGAA
jgi:predicted DNA-binding transcriptional regulator AlpA